MVCIIGTDFYGQLQTCTNKHCKIPVTVQLTYVASCCQISTKRNL